MLLGVIASHRKQSGVEDETVADVNAMETIKATGGAETLVCSSSCRTTQHITNNRRCNTWERSCRCLETLLEHGRESAVGGGVTVDRSSADTGSGCSGGASNNTRSRR